MVKKTMYQKIVQLKLQGYPQTVIAEKCRYPRYCMRESRTVVKEMPAVFSLCPRFVLAFSIPAFQ